MWLIKFNLTFEFNNLFNNYCSFKRCVHFLITIKSIVFIDFFCLVCETSTKFDRFLNSFLSRHSQYMLNFKNVCSNNQTWYIFFITFITFYFIRENLVVELTRSFIARSRIKFIILIFSIELLKLTKLILFKRRWLNSIDKIFKIFKIVLIIIVWMFFIFVRTIRHSLVTFQRFLLHYNFVSIVVISIIVLIVIKFDSLTNIRILMCINLNDNEIMLLN